MPDDLDRRVAEAQGWHLCNLGAWPKEHGGAYWRDEEGHFRFYASQYHPSTDPAQAWEFAVWGILKERIEIDLHIQPGWFYIESLFGLDGKYEHEQFALPTGKGLATYLCEAVLAALEETK